MKSYAPYLLYQVARFGALTVPQMANVCEGKCKRSSLYRALSELVGGNLVYPIMNPATRTRAYYATPSGRRTVFGREQGLTPGVRPPELDHTILCAEILLELCRHEKVTGVTTHFEIGAEDVKRFTYDRIPDGIVRLTQGSENFELAVEVESSVRNSIRVLDVLNKYWETFRRNYQCSGALVVSMSPTITGNYQKALAQMPEELQSRVKLLEGRDLRGLRSEAFGAKLGGLSRCLDLTRTSCLGDVQYSPVKTDIYLSQTSLETPYLTGVGQQNYIGGY